MVLNRPIYLQFLSCPVPPITEIKGQVLSIQKVNFYKKEINVPETNSSTCTRHKDNTRIYTIYKPCITAMNCNFLYYDL